MKLIGNCIILVSAPHTPFKCVTVAKKKYMKETNLMKLIHLANVAGAFMKRPLFSMRQSSNKITAKTLQSDNGRLTMLRHRTSVVATTST